MTKVNLEKRQIDLIEESVKACEKFNYLKRLYKDGKLSFSAIEEFVDDRGKSCLFRLKEMCHDLYRNSDDALYKEKLYDITVGYIFHEAMKLRENVYQLEYYRPKTFMFKDKVGEKEKKILKEMDSLIIKAEKRLREGISELRKLFKELSQQLKDLILLYRDNYLLPRFLLENQRLLISAYGRTGFKEILKELFQNGKSKLLYFAGLSYLSSDYYEEARDAFKKILNLENLNKEAIFFYRYACAFALYFKGKSGEANFCAQKARKIAKNVNIPHSFLHKLDGLILELKKEQKLMKKKF
ncbi:MAG: hypothetical protein N2513_06445 [Deltaproteobacteria bacterium]|nr:hypothetical protein [Deltaproteobacteria bacterium]